MKKGLCILLSAILVAGSFAACSKKGEISEDTTTIIDKNGNAIVVVTDKNGEAVTDKEGETVTSVLSDKEKEKIDKAGKTASKSDNSTEAGATTAKGKNDKSTTLEVNSKVVENVTSDDFDFTAGKDDMLDKGTTIAKKTTLFEDRVQKTLKTGKFTIMMNVKSAGQKMPMTLAFDKNRMYASFNMNGMQAGILYMNDTAYLLFPNLFNKKVYMEYPDMKDSMDGIFDSFDSIADNGQKYVGTSKVKDGKKELTCEEYKSDDGTVFKYYFNGKDWVRYECISDDDNMVYEISEFSGKVNDSLFSLKGYSKVDEKAFAGLMGGMAQ